MKTSSGRYRTKRQKLSGDRSGAAEIIGDILLVVMSVMMVSALALQISTVTEPNEATRADLEATYDGQNVSVLHMGGEALTGNNVRVYLFVNESLNRTLTVAEGRSGQNTWEMGQGWVYQCVTNPTQVVRVQVIDTKNHVVILDNVLQRGPDAMNVPDLGVRVEDICVLLRDNVTVDDNNTPMAGDNVTVNATIHNYGAAAAYSFLVRVYDYSVLDVKSYPVGNFTMSLNATSTQNLSGQYRIPVGSWGIHTITVRIVPLLNETRFANNYASKDYRVGYAVIAQNPGNPVLRLRSIDYFPKYPVHGNYVNLSARVANQGGVPANATIRYYDGSVSLPNLIGIESGVGVPVGGESISTVVWKATKGGAHTIIVNATDPNGTSDQKSIVIDVLPTVLLVDDDHAGEGGLRDVMTQMKGALDSVGASYVVHYVAGGDGPLYNGGEHPLKDYDLVIWMTGYEDTETLSANDQAALTKYLFDEKGRVWLIGQDIVSDLGVNNAFLNNVMWLSSATPGPYLNTGTTDPIVGKNILNGTEINMTKPYATGLLDRTDCLNPIVGRSDAAFAEKGGTGRANSILFNASTNITGGNAETYKAALFGFEPMQVLRTNDKSMMVYEMLKWFNCSATWGRDLSVSDQQFDKPSPSFMEEVNITMYVRNNGINDEPLDAGHPELQVAFYVDGLAFDPRLVTINVSGSLTTFDPSTSEIWIPQDTGNASLRVPGYGGYIKVSMVWTANTIGYHTITGKVDPYDYIEEINEYNNQVSSAIAKDSLYVRYGMLVVDDDGSLNNGGASFNSSGNLTKALDTLGYKYDLFVTLGASDGPSTSKLDIYNAIIWVAGQSADALTTNDKTNLTTFLNKGDGRYMWLIGQDAVNVNSYTGSASPDTFMRDYLRVGRVADPLIPKTPSRIEGANLDPVTHGIRYPTFPTFVDSGALVVPYIDGRGMMYQSPVIDPNLPNEMGYEDAQDGTYIGWNATSMPPLTTADIANIMDPVKNSQVIQVTRGVANAQNTIFTLGDWGPATNQNPNDIPWDERSRFTAQWTFNSAISYTFRWHVTDTVGQHHTLSYTNADSDTLGAEPVIHGLGAWTSDGNWHVATRDLLRDLREGTGWAGRDILRVDGFEVSINVGSAMVDDIQVSRPFNMVRYENSTNNFKTVFSGWEQSFVSFTGNDNFNNELVYMVMRYFNMYDTRTELRVTYLDMFYTNQTHVRSMKPMMGESYVLKARIWNPGGMRGDAVVRFSDGTTVIDSVTVTVEGGQYIMAEIIWTPLFAGRRTISVAVDPDSIVSEVFEFNNYASFTMESYFFYDDMEDGAAKWRHDATIARINGETPLEYMDIGTVNTRIISKWSQMDGWYNTTDNMSLTNVTSTYHSHSTAFYMHEAKMAARKPVDVVIVIDRSGSMGGQPLTDCKNAAKIFIDQMSSIDRVSVWSYESGVVMNIGFTFNKVNAKTAVDGIVVGGMTAGWTAMTQAVNYCINNGRADAVKCVVFLTDGNFNWDNNPYTKANTLIAIGNLHGPLFTIGLGGGINTVDLTDAAAASQGGQYYNAPTSAQLATIYQNIAQAIEDLAQTSGRATEEGGANERKSVNIFSDDFETDKGWTVTNNGGSIAQSTWQRNNYRSHSTSNSYTCNRPASNAYGNGENDWLASPVMDMSSSTYIGANLSFWYYPDIESSYDYTYVWVSNNNGASWTQIWSYGSQNLAWAQQVDLDLTNGGAISLTAQMQIRFVFTSDGSVTYTGMSIDDVWVNCTKPDPPQPAQAPPYWNNGDEVSRDRNLTTETFSLQGVSSAKLSFWHKYDLKVGSNGGVLLVGTAAAAAGPYSYRYIMPTQPYPNNLKISEWGTPRLNDSFSNPMRWCWNGISGAGKFTWDFVEADLTPYIGNQFVRVRFAYLFCDGGSGWGWAIDDVEVKVKRSDSVAVTAAADDQWELVQKGTSLGGPDVADAYSGKYSWLCHNPNAGATDYLKPGIDNSLISIPISLERAKDARLSAKLKFNINYSEGRPPDGFRVEVSNDNGVSWRQLNMGVRSAWNVSGSESAGPDGTSYTGVDLGNYWVHSSTVTRLSCDLSGWAGQVILLRFRVVTRNDTINHYQTAAGFGGVYVDDVFVTGNTTTGRSLEDAQEHPAPAGEAVDASAGHAQEGGEGSRAPAKPICTEPVDREMAVASPAGDRRERRNGY